jgi:tetratricopeptide (TPR) repeat protein
MSTTASTLMEEATRARLENRLADAHRDFAEAVALCRRSGLLPELVQALKGLGQIERGLGRADAALALYQEAAAICRREGDPLLLAHTVRHVGDLHRAAGRVELAQPCYEEALALYRANDRTDRLDLANALRPLAIVREGAGNVEEARRLWAEARDLYAAVGVEAGVAECSARLDRLGR